MASEGETGDVYEQLIAASETAFASGHYEAAYHALMAALHWANDQADLQRLQTVAQLANEQHNWLDTHLPTHRLSTQSSVLRGHQSVYDTLKQQVASMIRLRELKHG